MFTILIGIQMIAQLISGKKAGKAFQDIYFRQNNQYCKLLL